MFSENDYRNRSTQYLFQPKTLSFEDFSGFLSLLRKAHIDGKEKYLYPSAGGTYALQTYLQIKENAVEGIEPGVYYYHPEKHVLALLNTEHEIDRSVHFYYNRPHYDKSTFCLYFIVQTEAVAPIYGKETALAFGTIESGCLIQLLMQRQAAFNIGLCPVGGIDFEKIKEAFKCDESHQFIHSILGGFVEHQSSPDFSNERQENPSRLDISSTPSSSRDTLHIAKVLPILITQRIQMIQKNLLPLLV